jgi:hypothetical protein
MRFGESQISWACCVQTQTEFLVQDDKGECGANQENGLALLVSFILEPEVEHRIRSPEIWILNVSKHMQHKC